MITKNLSIVPDIVTIKPGERRPRTQSMVTYSNSIDGDWYIDELTNRLSYLSKCSFTGVRFSNYGLILVKISIRIYFEKVCV